MRLLLPALLLALLASGCGSPVPNDKRDYVGTWKAEGMELRIYPQGRVYYLRKKGSHSTKIDAPIKEYQGDDLVVGVWRFTTVFDVQKLPHEASGDWFMTVDGVVLKRISEAPQPPPRDSG